MSQTHFSESSENSLKFSGKFFAERKHHYSHHMPHPPHSSFPNDVFHLFLFDELSYHLIGDFVLL